MRNGVVRYMLELLEMGHQVSLTGVGNFTVDTTPASINTRDRIVSPPSSRIVFEADASNSSSLLITYIAYRTGLAIGQAEQHVEHFLKELNQRLDSDMLVTVELFGRFRKEENKVLFVADPAVENLRYTSLESVSLPSVSPASEPVAEVEAAVVSKSVSDDELIAAIAASSAASVESSPEVEEAKPEPAVQRKRSPLAILLPVFLMLFACVVILAVLQYNKSHEDPFATTIFNKTPKTTNPVIDEEMTPPEAAETTSTAELDSEQYQFDIYPSLEFNGLDSLVDTAGTVPIIDIEAIHEESVEEEKVDAEPTPEPRNEVAENEPIIQSGECYVVVGAFGVPANVTRMIERLNSMGYPADTMPNRGLTQVGVPADCSSAEIEEILQVLQSEVEPQAWIYNK